MPLIIRSIVHQHIHASKRSDRILRDCLKRVNICKVAAEVEWSRSDTRLQRGNQSSRRFVLNIEKGYPCALTGKFNHNGSANPSGSAGNKNRATAQAWIGSELGG